MTRYVFKMPDLGEGTVEAEVVAWHIKVGDMVQGRPGHGRGHDRQGGGGSAGAGQRQGRGDQWPAGRHGARRFRTRRVRDGSDRRR